MNRRSSETERIFLLEKVVLILSIVLLMEVKKKRHYLKFPSHTRVEKNDVLTRKKRTFRSVKTRFFVSNQMISTTLTFTSFLHFPKTA